eukprot:CAMPEP_0171667642 /NCGR_PEP_ID=MMETSP0990-20121206/48839_1 /TAXON_ID=483369 /ORGANISM="non described non described, Strain CCMP2098" /LENGTH=88 /DNA_ID=CAMNT_0012251427 /DNA_START=183 /DNA_END=449 /DNA_ORIENTATION=-
MKMLALTNNSWWYLGVYGCYSVCFATFSKVVEILPIGTAYATWAGVSTAGTSLIAAKFFGEPLSLPTVACLMLTISGIIGLNFLDGEQ